MTRRNYDATNRAVAALRALGRIEACDEGAVALARSTAFGLDSAEPGTTGFASCARAHALALERLRGLTTADNDTLDRLVADIAAVPASVVDTEDA